LFIAALPVILVFGFIEFKSTTKSGEPKQGVGLQEQALIAKSGSKKKFSIFSKAFAFALTLFILQSIANGSLLKELTAMLSGIVEVSAIMLGTIYLLFDGVFR
jgi:hypothetical protein